MEAIGRGVGLEDSEQDATRKASQNMMAQAGRDRYLGLLYW